MSKQDKDTIVAIATPPGRGGVAVLRVSGPQVPDLINTLFARNLPPRVATYLPFQDANQEVLDEGIAIYFAKPHSFTGEDVLELQGHGGPVVVDLLLQYLLTLGLRLAKPGEFSERAFLNGKMDLTQAEAVADLINASSQRAARLAMRSLQGQFSQAIHAINEKVIQLRLLIEAGIDFVDEEVEIVSDQHILLQLQTILESLQTLQQKARQGSFLREGITMVISGEPNVGKSSLLNQLSGKEVAIVTDIPGTTRDVLRDQILIDGMPVHVIDTAGLRESDDVVEQEGIRRAYLEIEQADLLLRVVDASQGNISILKTEKPQILIRNKIDLLHESPTIQMQDGVITVSLSAKSGAGIDLLLQSIKTLIGYESDTEGLFLARARHLNALSRAMQHTEVAKAQIECGRELIAEDLRLTQLALNEMTGEFTSDDLLGRIFSTFCIGK